MRVQVPKVEETGAGKTCICKCVRCGKIFRKNWKNVLVGRGRLYLILGKPDLQKHPRDISLSFGFRRAPVIRLPVLN